MRVRCKFVCTGVTKRKGWGGHEFVYDAEFSAVTSNQSVSERAIPDENGIFFAATPSGSAKLSTVKSDHFEVGREYYLDFTPAG